MSQSRRSTSRSSSSSNIDKNVSNSNTANAKRSSTTQKEIKAQPNQKSPAGYKVLGQEREMTEDELWDMNGQASDRYTPTSSRSSFGSRPVSNTSRRTPTPSKQISLQAVKRKEEADEPLEPIDWNDFNRAVSQNENRVPTLVESDSDSDDIPSPTQTPMSEEDRLALVEQRAKELTSALSTCRIDEQEADLSKKLEEIELEREKQREMEEAEIQAKSNNSEVLVNQSQSDRNVFEYSNKKDKISEERRTMDSKEVDQILIVKRTGENVIGKHAMDKVKDTAISKGSKNKDKSTDPESGKKDEASGNTGDTSSSDEENEEEDLMGERGKAPTALLMEFVTCLMDKDYQNAEKLCKMILIYEPDNPEALSFLPVIQEKRQIDAVEPEGSGSEGSDDESDDSGEEEDSDDDDDDDDDDDSSDDGSDDDDDDDDQGGNGDNDEPAHPDSGIASANSD